MSPLRRVPQNVIDEVVDQWLARLRACVKAKSGQHFEHLLYTFADFRRDLTGFLDPLTDFRGRLQNLSFFVVNVCAGSTAT